jgi:hypothetical protein
MGGAAAVAGDEAGAASGTGAGADAGSPADAAAIAGVAATAALADSPAGSAATGADGADAASAADWEKAGLPDSSARTASASGASAEKQVSDMCVQYTEGTLADALVRRGERGRVASSRQSREVR